MHALEFYATVRNGIIEIPREYLRNLTHRVRVILLVEEANAAVNFIDELLMQPMRVKGFRPLTREEVYAR
jgi:hypothetical protein